MTAVAEVSRPEGIPDDSVRALYDSTYQQALEYNLTPWSTTSRELDGEDNL